MNRLFFNTDTSARMKITPLVLRACVLWLIAGIAHANEVAFDSEIAELANTELEATELMGGEDFNCCEDCCCGYEVPWTIIPWIAGTSFDGATSESGFAYGVIGGYRLTDSLGAYGSFSFNHTDERTQFLSSVGIQKFGNPYGCTFEDRMTLWGFWDYYHDSEVDADTNQLRFNVGYVFGDFVEAGVTFSLDISDGPISQSPVGPAGGMFPGGGFVGGYFARSFDRFDLFGQLGHSDATDSVAGSLMAKVPLNDRAKVVVSGNAAEGSSGGTIGMEFGLGRNDTWQY